MADQILVDMIRPGLRAIFCGTAAGARSAQLRQYYAGPGNKFWRVLHATGLTPGPTPLKPEDWSKLDQFGIGLTDLAKEHFGSDLSLPSHAFDKSRLVEIMTKNVPSALAFNGKKAAEVFFGEKRDYGLVDNLGSTRIWVLPSTSGAANGYWQEDYWHKFAQSLPPA